MKTPLTKQEKKVLKKTINLKMEEGVILPCFKLNAWWDGFEYERRMVYGHELIQVNNTGVDKKDRNKKFIVKSKVELDVVQFFIDTCESNGKDFMKAFNSYNEYFTKSMTLLNAEAEKKTEVTNAEQ